MKNKQHKTTKKIKYITKIEKNKLKKKLLKKV